MKQLEDPQRQPEAGLTESFGAGMLRWNDCSMLIIFMTKDIGIVSFNSDMVLQISFQIYWQAFDDPDYETGQGLLISILTGGIAFA